MPNTNRTGRHQTPGEADRQSYHPDIPENWPSPDPKTVQQALDDLAAGAALPVSDAVALVKGNADATKQVRLEADAIATSTTRVLTMPDHDVDLGTDFAAASHNHNASDVDAGTLALNCGGAAASLGSVPASELIRMNGTQTALEGSGKKVSDLIGKSLVDAKGDLLVATANDTVARLAIGSNDHVLTADSSQTGGIKWAAATGGGDQGARVHNSVGQAIASSTWTTLTFDSERYDTDTIHSTVSNTDRLTCNTAGKYLVWFNSHFAYFSAGSRVLELRKTSGATTTTVGRHKHIYSAPGFHVLTLVDLAVNDYMTVRVLQDAGCTLNITADGDWSPEFAMQRVA